MTLGHYFDKNNLSPMLSYSRIALEVAVIYDSRSSHARINYKNK